MRPKTHHQPNRPHKDAARMDISNNDLARILGNIESNVAAQMQSSLRQEAAMASLDSKITKRLDNHDERLRTIEQANPTKIAETVKDHNSRINALEKGAARSGVIAGIGSSIAVAALVEFLKRKMGQ
ncbi:hypothetical protein [Undibacterium sp. Xuan67W]|uniref:hypothetical protein n=1 Tax=Undibacterium sp. Xuan67W TaxID=3413057 RepID=UPI003BF09406